MLSESASLVVTGSRDQQIFAKAPLVKLSGGYPMEYYEPNRKKTQTGFLCQMPSDCHYGRNSQRRPMWQHVCFHIVPRSTSCLTTTLCTKSQQNCPRQHLVKIITTSIGFFRLPTNKDDVALDVNQLCSPILVQGMATIPGVVGHRLLVLRLLHPVFAIERLSVTGVC